MILYVKCKITNLIHGTKLLLLKVMNEMSSFKNYVLSAAATAGATCKQHHACMHEFNITDLIYFWCSTSSISDNDYECDVGCHMNYD